MMRFNNLAGWAPASGTVGAKTAELNSKGVELDIDAERPASRGTALISDKRLG